MSEKQTIKIKTSDGIELAGDYYPGTEARGVICLHQYRADKSTYAALATRLQQDGFHVLTVDLRGHGDSEGSYEEFSENDFLKMFFDARAADEWLQEKVAGISNQMVGASIGANTALRYQEMNTLSSVVALSPGLNYHGIDPTDANMSNIAMPVLFINSEGDRYIEETRQLYDQTPLPDDFKKISIYPGDKHGVYILDENKEAFDEVVRWLKKYSKN